MMIIQATNFTVMLLAFLCIDTLSQKKKMDQIMSELQKFTLHAHLCLIRHQKRHM